MCGIPGSGKSTWIKHNLPKLNNYTCVVSRDVIRFDMVKEDEPYFSKEKAVYKKFIEEIKFCLATKDNDVIVDATHLTKGSRSKLLNALKGSLDGVNIIAIVIYVPLEVALQQNKNRIGTRGYVPSNVIINMFEQFEIPLTIEGFDEVRIYGKEI